MGRDERRESIEAVLARLDRPVDPAPGFADALEDCLLAELRPSGAGVGAQPSREGTLVRPHPATAANGRAPVWPAVPPVIAPRVRRWTPVNEAATAAVLLLTVLGVYLGANRGAAPPVEEAMSSFALFAADDDNGRLRQLDPATLADLPPNSSAAVAAPAIDPRARTASYPDVRWLASADGSTLVRVEDRFGAVEATVAVYDGKTGREQTRFRRPGPPVDAWLSGDGRRLVLRSSVDRGEQTADTIRWAVVDTSDGRLLATVMSAEPGIPSGESVASVGHTWAVDTGARRLYRLIVPGASPGSRPVPVALVAYDLETGTEVGRVEPPGVRSGSVRHDERVTRNGRTARMRVEERIAPALAISPNGERLAIVHGGGATITLVDAATLAVERTVALGPSATSTPVDHETVDPVTRIEEGDNVVSTVTSVRWMATFAPDGRHLYLAGSGLGTDAEGRSVRRTHGLRRVDLATGVVAARSEVAPWNIVPTPDGRGLYVFGLERVDPGRVGFEITAVVLRRLDAVTLASLAGPVYDLAPPALVIARAGDDLG